MFCGHEYAIQNLKFGLHVEPSNKDILCLLKSIETKRETKEPSVPSTIGKKYLYYQTVYFQTYVVFFKL